MSRFNSNKVMPRYIAIAIMLTLAGFAIVGKALYLMTAEKDYWLKVQQHMKRDSLIMMPARGNILSCDGQLMASSIPEYKIYMDFRAGGEQKDTLLMENMDSICTGLHEIFPEVTAEEFRKNLEEGRRKQSQHWPIIKKRIDYDTYTQVKQLPVFRLNQYKGGFIGEKNDARRRPFGTLAQRTIGEQWLDERPIYFFGNGAQKCMDVIQHPNAHLIEGIEPIAKWMMPLAEKRFLNEQFEDVAYFVPFYLKDFVAISPKKLL